MTPRLAGTRPGARPSLVNGVRMDCRCGPTAGRGELRWRQRRPWAVHEPAWTGRDAVAGVGRAREGTWNSAKRGGIVATGCARRGLSPHSHALSVRIRVAWHSSAMASAGRAAGAPRTLYRNVPQAPGSPSRAPAPFEARLPGRARALTAVKTMAQALASGLSHGHLHISESA